MPRRGRFVEHTELTIWIWFSGARVFGVAEPQRCPRACAQEPIHQVVEPHRPRDEAARSGTSPFAYPLCISGPHWRRSRPQQDLSANAKIPEARRSARKHAGAELLREPYMQWTNRKAVNGS